MSRNLRHRVDGERPAGRQDAAVAEPKENREQHDPALVGKDREADCGERPSESPKGRRSLCARRGPRAPRARCSTRSRRSNVAPAARLVPAVGLVTFRTSLKKNRMYTISSDRPKTMIERLMNTTMKSCQSRTCACSGSIQRPSGTENSVQAPRRRRSLSRRTSWKNSDLPRPPVRKRCRPSVTAPRIPEAAPQPSRGTLSGIIAW